MTLIDPLFVGVDAFFLALIPPYSYLCIINTLNITCN